jgi:magnesium transporter
MTIVDCAHYLEGKRQKAEKIEPAEAAEIARGEPGFIWMGMVEPSPEELAAVQDEFGLHELAVEDAQSFHLRPKVEGYEGGISFVVLRTARYLDDKEEVEFGEVSIFVGPGFVITVRQGAGSDLHGARLRLEQRPHLLEEGPASVLWAIIDKIVDDYAPVVEGLEEDIEQVERLVFSGAAAPTHRIYLLRREVTDFYRAVHPLLGPAAAIVQGGVLDDISEGLRAYFRDVEDHLKLVNEEIVAQRDLLSTILQANMAVVSNEQNDVVRKISSWAAIITVPTFITSFYGMNTFVPDLHAHATFAAAVALMLLSAVGLWVLFKRVHWL